MTTATDFVSEERARLADLADWYFDEQLDFDVKLIRYGYETLKPYMKGPRAAELGSGDGQMTRLLVNDFESLTVVDGAAKLLASIPEAPNLTKVHSLFEEFEPSAPFNTIVMTHILEHIDDVVALVSRAKHWLAPGGNLVTIVPNSLSFHRLAAVKMGLLQSANELNARDKALGHRRVYNPDEYRADFEKAGMKIVAEGGIFFKPLTHRQIQDQWTPEMIQGFFELGRDFPRNAAEIYLVATNP